MKNRRPGVVAKGRKSSTVASGRRPKEAIELGDLTVHAGTYLLMFSRIMNTGIEEVMARHPIGAGQGRTSTLQAIAHNPGISQIELSDIFSRDRSAQLRINAGLERLGLIRREADPGHRQRHMLFVTPAGRRMISELEKIAHEFEAKTFSVLSAKEYRSFRRILASLWKRTIGPGGSYWPEFDGK